MHALCWSKMQQQTSKSWKFTLRPSPIMTSHKICIFQTGLITRVCAYIRLYFSVINDTKPFFYPWLNLLFHAYEFWPCSKRNTVVVVFLYIYIYFLYLCTWHCLIVTQFEFSETRICSMGGLRQCTKQFYMTFPWSWGSRHKTGMKRHR